eukprot:scaffold45767_cov32-Attheya_sp.AAC.4
MAPVIGPTPSSSQEEDSAAIPDAGGDEDEASVNSAVSASSITSEVGTVVDPSIANYLEVQPSFCRVVSVDPSTGGLSHVCCRGSKCRKTTHAVGRKSPEHAAHGIYQTAMRLAGRIVGAVPGSLMSSEDVESVAAARRASDVELVAKARASTRRRPVVEE